jgi:hypothetical protein
MGRQNDRGTERKREKKTHRDKEVDKWTDMG